MLGDAALEGDGGQGIRRASELGQGLESLAAGALVLLDVAERVAAAAGNVALGLVDQQADHVGPHVGVAVLLAELDRPAPWLPTDALRSIFEANFFGWHELTRQVLPVMRKQGHGRIIQNSSILGFVAFPWRGAYVATKYAIEGLTDTLRVELHDTDIHVVLIEPGPVTSKIREKSIPHFERFIDWEKSPLRGKYESTLLKRLYESSGPDRFELPASAVTAKLAHACESRRPRPRYYVTTPTHIGGFLRRILSTRASDRILAKIGG